MSEPKLTQQDVQEILNLVESAAHVTDFSLKYGDVEVRLSRHGHGEAPPAAQARAVPGPSTGIAPPAAAAKTGAVAPGMTAIKAPMVGTFYRAPAPGAAPFVEVGQRVTPDSVVCIIEVMKLMSSISAGISGTVAEIRVADSEPVQFGQVLIVIEPAT
jgi:acetyl-CoA carboxylase biotin carboxyl carrier protein